MLLAVSADDDDGSGGVAAEVGKRAGTIFSSSLLSYYVLLNAIYLSVYLSIA